MNFYREAVFAALLSPSFASQAERSNLSVYLAPLFHLIDNLVNSKATILAAFATFDIFSKARSGKDARFTWIPAKGIALHDFDPNALDLRLSLVFDHWLFLPIKGLARRRSTVKIDPRLFSSQLRPRWISMLRPQGSVRYFMWELAG